MGQYLTFQLGREEYAIEILRVQEIRGHSRITPIPNTPAYVKGVINLRGTVVPVVDLRCRLGMPETSDMRFSAIVVVTVGTKIVGLFVDEVEYAAVSTEVIDTTGAGDALAAGYLIGGPPLGLEAAARCCAQMGAMP